MSPERDVLRVFAKEITEQITRKTISALQKRKETLSGDDSELSNVWDEICVQVQFGESPFWDAYEDTAKSFVSAYIDELTPHQLLALWLQTDQGRDWLNEIEDGPKGDGQPPVANEDIIQFVVHEHLYALAGEWTNKRIRAYMTSKYLD